MEVACVCFSKRVSDVEEHATGNAGGLLFGMREQAFDDLEEFDGQRRPADEDETLIRNLDGALGGVVSPALEKPAEIFLRLIENCFELWRSL